MTNLREKVETARPLLYYLWFRLLVIYFITAVMRQAECGCWINTTCPQTPVADAEFQKGPALRDGGLQRHDGY
ncbi:hypothetical protein EV426DRAFT_590598 [Tirmania nivea]|nr:hypothetical protein EV426DRAFT_590598 [Tirmania nivea]